MPSPCTADPDEKFALDGNALELDATLDHATAATHSVTIEADNGIDLPLSRAFTIIDHGGQRAYRHHA